MCSMMLDASSARFSSPVMRPKPSPSPLGFSTPTMPAFKSNGGLASSTCQSDMACNSPIMKPSPNLFEFETPTLNLNKKFNFSTPQKFGGLSFDDDCSTAAPSPNFDLDSPWTSPAFNCKPRKSTGGFASSLPTIHSSSNIFNMSGLMNDFGPFNASQMPPPPLHPPSILEEGSCPCSPSPTFKASAPPQMDQIAPPFPRAKVKDEPSKVMEQIAPTIPRAKVEDEPSKAVAPQQIEQIAPTTPRANVKEEPTTPRAKVMEQIAPTTPRANVKEEATTPRAKVIEDSSCPTTPPKSMRRCPSSPPGAPKKPDQPPLMRALQEATGCDRLRRVQEVLAEDPQAAALPFWDHGCEPPLCCAARMGSGAEVFKLLMCHGADVNATDVYGRTPLVIVNSKLGDPAGFVDHLPFFSGAVDFTFGIRVDAAAVQQVLLDAGAQLPSRATDSADMLQQFLVHQPPRCGLPPWGLA
ncbi:unnamed protein product [Polarella glacialis]|uniref:Uncharacterized protein n=1 Tax=Polarella glacialis TaxID=89957 RepID=A0A813JSI1_POLGL|nr:unnamed protein product [Polarella glacialis]